MYDETQFERWNCKNANEYHAKYSQFVSMLYRRYQIKRDQCRRKFIACLLYRREQIKKSYHNECSSDKSESKSIHISINKHELKYGTNETNFEEPSVTDNSVINAPSYFKIFKCSKTFLNNFYATYERACMVNPMEKYDTAVLMYGQA